FANASSSERLIPCVRPSSTASESTAPGSLGAPAAEDLAPLADPALLGELALGLGAAGRPHAPDQLVVLEQEAAVLADLLGALAHEAVHAVLHVALDARDAERDQRQPRHHRLDQGDRVLLLAVVQVQARA